MNLIDLKPTTASFTLKAAKRSFKMNPVSLSDEIWMQETYGDKISQIFMDVDIKEISRIVYRLIDNEDKSFFKTRTVTLIDEDGDETEEQMGGVKLLMSMIVGNNEKIELLNALTQTIGVSRPEHKEPTVKKKKVVKKKVVKKKKR